MASARSSTGDIIAYLKGPIGYDKVQNEYYLRQDEPDIIPSRWVEEENGILYDINQTETHTEIKILETPRGEKRSASPSSRLFQSEEHSAQRVKLNTGEPLVETLEERITRIFSGR